MQVHIAVDGDEYSSLIPDDRLDPETQASSKSNSCKTITTIALVALNGAAIGVKIWNLTEWNAQPLIELGTNLTIGGGAALLLRNSVSTEQLHKLTNFLNSYAQESFVIETQAYLNIAQIVLSVALSNQLMIFPIELLLGFLSTDAIVNAITSTQSEILDNNSLGVKKPIPMLQGDARNLKHLFLLTTAKSVISATALYFGIVLNQPYLYSFGVFTGANACGNVFSTLIRKWRDRERLRIAQQNSESFVENTSYSLSIINTAEKLLNITFPIITAVTNAVIPRFCTGRISQIVRPDAIITGGLVGMVGAGSREKFQDECSSEILEEESSSRTSSTNSDLEDLRPISNEFDDQEIGDVAEHPPINSTEHPEGMSKTRKILSEITFRKTIKFMAEKGHHILAFGGFLLATVAFALWTFITGSTRDQISMASILGGMFVGYAFTYLVGSKLNPRTRQENPLQPKPQLLVSKTRSIVRAASNSTYYYTCEFPFYWVLVYFLASSLAVNLDDSGYQNSSWGAYATSNFALASWGATIGNNRRLQDTNQARKVAPPLIYLASGATTATLQGMGAFN